MLAVIPAAGLGTRLHPLTKDAPKALVHVCERPLISYTLEWLSQLAIAEVLVVSGHRGADLREQLPSFEPRPNLSFIDNPDYRSTNSIASLALTVPYWTDPVFVIDSDVLASPDLLARLVDAGPSALVVDTTKDFDSADMKVELRDQSVWHMDKTIAEADHQGEFFGLSRWSGDGMRLLASTLQHYVESGQTNVWYEFAIRDVAKLTKLAVIEARSDEWAEIDQPSDIPSAERLISRLLTVSACQ